MRGVRGFGDPHPVTLPSGKPVWHQAEGSTAVPPFRPNVGNLALTFIEDLDHTWDGTHQMFNDGNWDRWLPAKTTACTNHLPRNTRAETERPRNGVARPFVGDGCALAE